MRHSADDAMQCTYVAANFLVINSNFLTSCVKLTLGNLYGELTRLRHHGRALKISIFSGDHTMKVLLVSRNSFFTSALGAVLEQDGIRFSISTESFLTLCKCRGNAVGTADVLVMDVGEGLSEVTFGALAKLHQDQPRLRSMLVVPGFDAAQLARIFASGPVGCVQSSAPLSTFPQYVRLVAEGQRVLPDGAADVLHRLVQSTRPLASFRAIKTGLTQRETQVLGQLLRGAPNKEIARVLSVPLTTVKSDVKSIMQKTGAANRTALAVSAVQAGVMQAEQATLHCA